MLEGLEAILQIFSVVNMSQRMHNIIFGAMIAAAPIVIGAGVYGIYKLDEYATNQATNWNAVEELANKSNIELKTENVQGLLLLEQFYLKDGKRVFLSIDGKLTEDYYKLSEEIKQ